MQQIYFQLKQKKKKKKNNELQLLTSGVTRSQCVNEIFLLMLLPTATSHLVSKLRCVVYGDPIDS